MWVTPLLGLALVTTGCVSSGTIESEGISDLVDQASTVPDAIENEEIAEAVEAAQDEVAELVDSGDTGSDEPVTEEEANDSTSTTPTAPAVVEEPDDTTTTTVDEEPLPVTPDRWAGTYSWTEFVESDVGSNQTLTHEFTLEAGNSTLMEGTYSASGFQTDSKSSVISRLNEGGDLVIYQGEQLSGLQTGNEVGDILVIFQGDPSDPTTALVEINNLNPSIRAQGKYFERV